MLPTDIYRRLTTDLGANGCKVAADLAGERLEAVLAGGPDLIKVSHEELLADGRASPTTPATSSRRCAACATTAPGRSSSPAPAPHRRSPCSTTAPEASAVRSSRSSCRRWNRPIPGARATP